MSELPLYTTGKSREERLCRATIEQLRFKSSRPGPAPCQATWTKSTAPWLKKERARIAAEIEANKRGMK